MANDFSKKEIENNLLIHFPEFEKLPIWLKSEIINGFVIELEHGLINQKTNVTNSKINKTLKIVLAHLSESPDYYNNDKYGLLQMEKNLNNYWNSSPVLKIEKSRKISTINDFLENIF